MKRSVWTSPSLLLIPLALLASSGAFGQEAGGGNAIASVVRAWGDPLFWVFLLVVAAFGSLGGLVYELMTLRGRLEMPHRADDVAADEDLAGAVARYLYDLGLLGRMIIGALAAIVVVWPLGLVDSGPLAVISGSIVAGAAGIAVFRSLQDRLMAALATRELVKVQVRAAEQTRAVEEIEADVEQLRGRLQGSAGSAERGLSFGVSDDRRGGAETTSAPESFPELDRITRKLAEARALGMAAAGGRRESVRLRVYKVLSTWSGVPVVKVPPDGKKITVLWQENSGNPQINEGVLSDLIFRLKAEFPQAQIALVPSDLTRDDATDTVGKLVSHVEPRMLGQ